MDILLGASLGLLVGFLLAIPSVILEASRRVKNLPLLIDVHTWNGKKLSDGEVFSIGFLLHLLVALSYGALRVAVIELGWFEIGEPFSFASMIVFALLLWFLLNILLLPALGLGLFGRSGGGSTWLELLISLLLEASILWILIQYYQPAFFAV